jgi:AcrR family transcriptional regulator
MARKAGTTSQDTEAQIYSAARNLFARYGYAAVSMRRIAGDVGVNQAALYHYTPTKQDLLAGLLTRHMSALLEAIGAEDFPDDPVRALDHFARFHIRYHIPRAAEIFLSYMELRSLDSEHFTAINALRSQYEEILRQILKTGLKSGAFSDIDPAISAMAILSMLTGITNWYSPEGRLNQPEIETCYSRLVLGSVGASL